MLIDCIVNAHQIYRFIVHKFYNTYDIKTRGFGVPLVDTNSRDEICMQPWTKSLGGYLLDLMSYTINGHTKIIILIIFLCKNTHRQTHERMYIPGGLFVCLLAG